MTDFSEMEKLVMHNVQCSYQYCTRNFFRVYNDNQTHIGMREWWKKLNKLWI